jgi:hypothetical protein
MDDSPSDTESQPELLSPYPYRMPDNEPRPWPDLMAIRLVPVPNSLPPYDDELPGAQNGPALLVAHENDELAAGSPGTGPADETSREESSPYGDQDHEDKGDGSGNGSGDGIGQWPSQFAQVLAETLAGARPASQLTPWTTERARAHIRRLGPLLAVDRRPRVQRVRSSQPDRDVLEVAVVAEFGTRTRALAARLERSGAQPATPGRPAREPRWLCTAIESA